MSRVLAIRPAELRRAREEAGFTQHQLAREVGVVGGERVSRWELGRSAPRLEQLRRIAEVLGVSIADLLELPETGLGLRELRLLAGLDALELAMKVNVSARTLRRWEEGEFQREVPLGTQRLLGSALGVSVGEVDQALRVSRSQRRAE